MRCNLWFALMLISRVLSLPRDAVVEHDGSAP
jgi:hypothetical protein